MKCDRYVYGIPYDIDHPEKRGLPCYIGMGSNKRKDVHNKIARSGKIYRANKGLYAYLADCQARGVTVTPYIIAKGLSVVEAYLAEVNLILKYGRLDLGTGCLMNASAGGSGSRNPSASTRDKMSKAHTGKKMSPEAIAKTRAGHLGLKFPGQGARISAALKGRAKDPDAVKRSADWHRGRKRTEAIKAKMSAAHKGVAKSASHRTAIALAMTGTKRTEESKAKQSAAMLGRPKSAETREKMRAAALIREAKKRANQNSFGSGSTT